MERIEFEITLDESRTIEIPDEIVSRLREGDRIHISITQKSPEDITPEEAWQAALKTIDALIEKGATPGAEPYKWNRDELYDHLI